MKTRHPLVLIPQHFGSLVFDRRSSRYLPFDEESTACLTRLRKEPVEDLAKDHPGLIPFYDHFAELGFFDLSGRFAGDVLSLNPPPDHLAGPLAVHLEIAAACNLTCRHCFAGPLPRHQDPLQLEELDALFQTLAAMGSFRLGLTGGEPLLRHDLFQIVDMAVAHGLHPCLTTNGLLITEKIAKEFGKREFVWLNVSLDGASAASNDQIRGAGTFDRVMHGLSLLRQHARFTLAFTIMSSNHSQVQECAELAQRVGADSAVFRPLYPVGIAKDNMELMPTFSQYTDALQTLAGDLHGIDPFSPHTRAEKQARVFSNNGCGAGNLVCSISVQGNVNPCSFLGTSHDAGNIRDVPFHHIWHESRGFRSIRDCDDERFCGGCRARSQAFEGSIHAPDPWHDEWAQRRSNLHPLSNVEA
jgi:radical SAM protein with 4Fe4S-binding SPASM domain